jgi:hypothetical protein
MADNDEELERELAALASWAGFPADRSPRPIVLTGRDRVRVPSTGFPDVEHKQAHLAGAVVTRCEMPAAVLDALRGDVQPYQGDPLVVSSATREEAEFESDRGPVLLPAWNITVDDVPGVFVVLDPMVAEQAWSASEPTGAGLGYYDFAVGDPRGVTLTLSFIGSPKVYTDYHPPLRVHTSPGAVVAGLAVAIDISGGGPRDLYAQRREVTVGLPEPLGNRVLVNPFGQPIPVLPQAPPTRGSTGRHVE